MGSWERRSRNFQNIRKQTAAQAAEEREREEASLQAKQEEKRLQEEVAVELASKDPKAAHSLFDAIGDSFSAAQRQIDAQLAEVNKQATALGSSVSNGIQAAGQDVTNRLNALITLLERVNQKPPEETEEEKRKKRKLTLEVAKLEFVDWNIHILAVSSSPFKFKKWELEKYKGAVGGLARQCASGLLNEIIADFQQEILNNLTKDIAAVGDGLLNVGGHVIGGVAEGGNMIVGGITTGAGAIGKGLSDTGEVIGKGLTDTTSAIGKGLTDTSTAVEKGLSDTSSAISGLFGWSSSASKEEQVTEITETSTSTTTTATTMPSTNVTVTEETRRWVRRSERGLLRRQRRRRGLLNRGDKLKKRRMRRLRWTNAPPRRLPRHMKSS